MYQKTIVFFLSFISIATIQHSAAMEQPHPSRTLVPATPMDIPQRGVGRASTPDVAGEYCGRCNSRSTSPRVGLQPPVGSPDNTFAYHTQFPGRGYLPQP